MIKEGKNITNHPLKLKAHVDWHRLGVVVPSGKKRVAVRSRH